MMISSCDWWLIESWFFINLSLCHKVINPSRFDNPQ
jgi:hypothetical protein